MSVETCVIGASLFSPSALLVAREALAGDEFSDDRNKTIWDIICKMDDRGAQIDQITLSQELQKAGKLTQVGGSAYLAGAISETPAPSRIGEYCKILREQATLRALRFGLLGVSHLAEKSTDPEAVLTEAENIIYRAREGKQAIEVYRAEIIANATMNSYKSAKVNPNHTSGIPIGLDGLGSMVKGWKPGTLTFIGARPGVGKTSLVCAAVREISKRNAALVLSLEMRMQEIADRIMAAEIRVNAEKIESGRMNPEEEDRMTAAATGIGALKLSIVDKSGIGFQQIRAICRRERMAGRLEILFIDHFQIIGIPGKGTRYAEFSEISTGLKRLAKDLNIPIVCLAQLSREAGDGEPRLHHLKETGSIEQDADTVILMHRPDDKKDQVQLIVAKNRAGRTGCMGYRFTPEICEFRPLMTLEEDRNGPGY